MSFTSRWGDVYLAAGARAVSVCGDFLAATTLALVLQGAGHGGLAISGLMVAASLPLALLVPVAGRIADRVDSRRVLVVAGFGQALVCLVLAGTDHPVAIIGLVALLACGLAIVQPTLSALLPDMVAERDLAKASGIYQTAGVLGMMVAPALAGVLVGQMGPRLPLLIDAASYLALVVAGLALRTRRHHRGGSVTAAQVPYRVRDDRTLSIMIGVLAASVAAMSSINVLMVFLVRDTLGASTTVYGLVEAAWTAGMLVGTVVFARLPRRLMTVRAVLLTVVVSGVPLLLGASVSVAPWLIPLWIIGGMGNGGTNVLVMVIVASRAPSRSRGRAFAALGSTVQAAGLLGLAAAGPLVDRFDPRVLVASAATLSLIIAVTCLMVVRRETPQPTVDPERVRDSVGA
ncbi:MFS transporter [Paractinoplanes rishiriensis]|uniref:MFS transporter n=1 Tax=Paractinoplanes rishiriensis TaxID=1050105 RepID=A0A919K2U3_9ACTN|nr:MFS transporter [Actinoplanes rishiriensis]GIE98207.1 MFS transporter [Actinoplanes rishiriensis]